MTKYEEVTINNKVQTTWIARYRDHDIGLTGNGLFYDMTEPIGVYAESINVIRRSIDVALDCDNKVKVIELPITDIRYTIQMIYKRGELYYDSTVGMYIPRIRLSRMYTFNPRLYATLEDFKHRKMIMHQEFEAKRTLLYSEWESFKDTLQSDL